MTDELPVEEIRAALDGERGDAEQFRFMVEHGKKIIDLALDLKRIMPTSTKVCVTHSLIYKP